MARSGYDVTGCGPGSAAYDTRVRNRNRNQSSSNTVIQAQTNEVAPANHTWTAPELGPVDEQALWRLAPHDFSLDHRPSHGQKVYHYVSGPRSGMSYYPMGGASISEKQATNADSSKCRVSQSSGARVNSGYSQPRWAHQTQTFTHPAYPIGHAEPISHSGSIQHCRT